MKSRSLVRLKCVQCSSEFQRTKSAVLVVMQGNQRRTLNFCGRECAVKARTTGVSMYPCAKCGKMVPRHPSDLRSKSVYCSRSCSAFVTNKIRTTGVKRSKGEEVLACMIRADFPTLAVRENVRDFLASGLEIDLLIEGKNVAIELNGPVHYTPIYGDERLSKIQSFDARKQRELQELGIILITVNITECSRRNKYHEFFSRYYPSHIKPLLE